MQAWTTKRVIYPLNLPVSWACWESILKSCTLRIETLDDLFRTSSAKWICLLTHYAYMFQHIQSCLRTVILYTTCCCQILYVLTGEGCTRPFDSLLMDHLPMCFSDFPQSCKQSLSPWSTAEHCWQGQKLLLPHSCNAHVLHGNCALTANSNTFL